MTVEMRMSSIQQDLASFHQFAMERISRGELTVPLYDLFMEWCDFQSQDEINVAIRRGLADIDTGRYQPADEAMNDICRDFQLPPK